MTQEHPINPPPELVKQWREQAPRCRDGGIAREDWLMTSAARWGAEQELEACCEFLGTNKEWNTVGLLRELRAARRPKPSSLKGRIAAEIENGTACDRESERITHDVIREVAAWIDYLGYPSCAAELRKELPQSR
jgi:hypothetical protein